MIFCRKSSFENISVSHENSAKLFGIHCVIIQSVFYLRANQTTNQMQMATCTRVQSETDLLAEK